MVEKFKATGSTDDELVKECQQKTNCGDCEPPISWTDLEGGERTEPPDDTLAIIIVVRRNQGAVHIYKKESGDWVDGVGSELAPLRGAARWIVSWDPGWYFSPSGFVRIGYVAKRKST